MFERLSFYTRHSFNDLRVNGQRTIFALLCIAAGVAAIVSLQTLGVMIEDSLTSNLQESNRGDISARVRYGNGEPEEDGGPEPYERAVEEGLIVESDGFSGDYVAPVVLDQLRAWLDENASAGSVLTYRQAANGISDGTSILNPAKDTDKSFVMPFIIDAGVYPLYGTRETKDGQAVGDLLQEPTDIVLSENLAEDLDAAVGDRVRLNGAREDFTVRGIMATDEEGGFDNIFGSLFGYYFINMSAIDLFTGIDPGADIIYIKLGDPARAVEIGDTLEDRFPYLEFTTTDDLEEQNSEISTTINELVIIMGLVSLLIGGIGIVNTMLVIVSRRTTEIAVLKTIGLEGPQVTTLFLVEAVLMGIFGSLLGIVLGWIAAYGVKGVAEHFLGQSLVFHITPLPAITGLVVGVIVTAIFGFLPTLAAGQVRPNLVLRPSDSVVPRAGRARSFAALLAVVLALSLIAQVLTRDLLDSENLRAIGSLAGGGIGVLMGLTLILGGLFTGWTRGRWPLRLLRWALFPAGLGVLGLAYGGAVPAVMIMLGTFVGVGVLYVVLWVLIWLVGRFFPAWRVVDLKVALRAMLATKGRNASTLLALVIGVFTLSLITMLVSAITERFQEILVNEAGGNLIVFAAGMGDTQERVEAQLDAFQAQGDVNSYSALNIYDASLLYAYDQSAAEQLDYQTLVARVKAGDTRGMDYDERFRWAMDNVDGRGIGPNLPDVDFYAGRQLDEGDTGPWSPEDGRYPPLVVSADEAFLETGLEVGDLMTFRFFDASLNRLAADEEDAVDITFEIVGMIDRTGAQIYLNVGSQSYAPRAAFPAGLTPAQLSAIVDADESKIRELRQSMNEIPGVFVLETKLLNDLVTGVIEQFTSFPTLVAALSLIVGGIVIANSVALSTLERRREIAIMKAVGLQRERVLGMLLMEYGLMGFIGGLIGVGIGGLGLLFLLTQVLGGELGNSIPYMTALTLMLLCIGIALIAAVLSAWGASGEKPLNVLRYE